MPHSTRLYDLRKAKGLTRARLAQLSRVSVRTIQRLENPTQGNRTPHRKTLERLAKVLQVEPEVLIGETPLPRAGKAPAPEPRRAQIGVEIAPKARLAYDLVKRRYGVSATEIINMAPLFFALLAEGSLARRLENLKEAGEAIGRLDQMGDEIGHPIFRGATTVALYVDTAEEGSINKADIFGDHLLDDDGYTFFDGPFDPTTENPFAGYLRRLAADLDRPGVVKVERDSLSYGAPWLRFPDYDLCDDELDDTTNRSPDARRVLETGWARLSDIPEELEGEDAGEERAAWLEERLPDVYKDLEEGQPMTEIARFEATATPTEMKEFLERVARKPRSASQNERGTEEEGDLQ